MLMLTSLLVLSVNNYTKNTQKAFPTFGAGPPLLTLRVDVPWQLQRERNAVVLGTWEENAFQVSLRDRAVIEDPLHIPLFSDVLPYHCIPHMYDCVCWHTHTYTHTDTHTHTHARIHTHTHTHTSIHVHHSHLHVVDYLYTH